MGKTEDTTFVPTIWADGIDTADTVPSIIYSYPGCTAWACGRCGAYYIDFGDYAEHAKNCNVEYRPVIDIIHTPGVLIAPSANESLARIASALERIAEALEKRGL